MRWNPVFGMNKCEMETSICDESVLDGTQYLGWISVRWSPVFGMNKCEMLPSIWDESVGDVSQYLG